MAAECCQRADLCRDHCGKKRPVGTSDRIIRISLSPPAQPQGLADTVAADHASAHRVGSHVDAGAFSSSLSARSNAGSLRNGSGAVGRASRSEQFRNRQRHLARWPVVRACPATSPNRTCACSAPLSASSLGNAHDLAGNLTLTRLLPHEYLYPPKFGIERTRRAVYGGEFINTELVDYCAAARMTLDEAVAYALINP